MHLTKEDIEHVAWSRFNKENTKHFYLLLLGGCVALVAFMLGLDRLFPGNMWPAVSAGTLIMGLLCVGLYRYFKLQQRAAEEFVKQCEADPYLIYIGDKTQQTETASQTQVMK